MRASRLLGLHPAISAPDSVADSTRTLLRLVTDVTVNLRRMSPSDVLAECAQSLSKSHAASARHMGEV